MIRRGAQGGGCSIVLAAQARHKRQAMSPDRVHILMCTRNGARWLPAQLDSLCAQTHPNWVLWVSDDGSEDATRAILEDFAARHPGRVAAIMEGPGQGSAVNFLSLLCHPDLPAAHVALCDQDDVWLPHKLAHAMAQLRPMEGQACGWSGRFRVCQSLDAAQVTPDACPQGYLPAPWPRGPSLGNAVVQNIMSGHTLTLTPEALALIRRAGPVQVPHHDWWIYLLLMACDARALIDPEVVLKYRQHGRNVLGRRTGLRARLARLEWLLNDTMRRWIAANLDALAAADLPLSPRARALLAARDPQGGLGTLRQRFALHRQSRAETLLLMPAIWMRRL